MKNKISIIKIIGLLLIFISIISKQFIPMFQNDYVDSRLWSHYGLRWLGGILTISGIMLYSFFIYLYAKRMKPGYVVANVLLVVWYIKFTVEYFLTMRNIDLVRQWYFFSRERRGFPVSVEKTEAVITEPNAFIMYIVTTIIFLIIFITAYLKRKRFSNKFEAPGR